MYLKCFALGEFTQAIGIALESRSVEKLEEAIKRSGQVSKMLAYTYKMLREVLVSRDFRNDILTKLVELQLSLSDKDYSSICELKFLLQDPSTVAQVLNSVLGNDPALAYQLAFDLSDAQNQSFINAVLEMLEPIESLAPQQTTLKKILSGRPTIDAVLEFSSTACRTDKLLISNIKAAVEAKNSVTHSAAITTNSFMYAGTAQDHFLRENLEWVAKANNWAKFSAAASLGVIHRGNLDKAMTILQPYLPGSGGANESPYAAGGALYALGFIYANHFNVDRITYLTNSLQTNQNEIVQHGACFGIGLIAIATGDSGLYETLENVVYTDSAVAGEAAAYAMGLVMLGTANSHAIQRILSYSHETQHEKIIRALAISLALIVYGREEEADGLITQLLSEKDPILRYGGVYAIATAYFGTGNNKLVQKLLHIAVSDVDYDVRRAAVTSIGFLLYRTPEQVPKIVSLLSDSYNPHVRQGVAMAIGVACAAKPNAEALNILETLMSDSTNYVRQAALIATAMLLVQAHRTMNARVEKFRKKLDEIITEKDAETQKKKPQETLTKMGALLAYGILDAGGRNSTIALTSKAGLSKPMAVAGMVLGQQFWYWYPLIHFNSLTFAPTCIIGVNEDLKIPKTWSVLSRAPPSYFDYPPNLEPPTSEKVARTSAVVLSTTVKVKARAALKKGESVMDIEEPKVEEGKEEVKDKSPEPTEQVLANLSRVLPAQERYIEFPESRYIPAVLTRKSGIMVLRDKTPGEAEEFPVTSAAPQAMDLETEVDMPEEFDFDPNVQSRAFS
jgi:26S proteasome regulatory subunit N2